MLKISLLGEQTIEDDVTGEIRSRSSRTLALVGRLATQAGTPVSRQRVAGLFWPDSSDAQSLTNLRRELHHLRRLLGEDGSLVVTSTDLCWRDTPSCRVDVRVLRTCRDQARRRLAAGDLEAAARLAAEGCAAYGGDLLPMQDDDWVLEEREALRRQCVGLCDLLADVDGRVGDLAGAQEAARRRIALEPLEEVGYRALMALQTELGDRAGAISTYHHCASVLERELGVAPGPETRRAMERLIGPTGARPGPRRRPGPPPQRAGAAATPLIGRAAPLQALTALWTSTVLDSRPRVVAVRGVAGVGKSRLVDELAEQVRGRATVVATHCFDTSGRLALAPVADWLRSPDLRAAARAVDPVWRREVERLVPDETPTSGAAPPAAGARAKVDAWQRHRFFEGLARPFLAVHRPLLVVLDNLQWCDEETLAWLSFLLRLGEDRPLMVAMTLRDEPRLADPEATAWLSRVRTAHHVEEVPLAPLDAEQTATLSAAVAGRRLSTTESALLFATTGGFPLFVIEATRASGDADRSVASRERLGSVLRRRIAETSAPAQQIAGLAAALGRDFTLELLTEASDLDADTVARSVDELWRQRVVGELGAGYDFSHDLLRDAAYESVSPARRWLLHRRLAQALELTTAGREDELAALLAEQYERGGRPDRAREYYGRAAEVAAQRFAATEAIRLHRLALDIIVAQPPGRQRDERELDCLLALAAPLNASQGYSSPQLRATLERAVRLAENIGSRTKLVTALIGLWASRFVRGDILAALELATRARSVAGADEVQLGEAEFTFAGASVTLGRPAQAVEHFEMAHDRCRGAESLVVGTMPEVHALAWSAHAHWLLGQRELARDRAVEAVARARSFAHPYSLGVALAYGAITHQMLGDRRTMRDMVGELGKLCSGYGFAYYSEWQLVLAGWLAGGAAGLARQKRGIANLRGQSSLVRMPYWLALQADTQARCGRTGDAVATLDAAETAAAVRGDAWWLPEIRRMRAGHSSGERREKLLRSALELAEQQGSVALAHRCLEDLVDPCAEAFGQVRDDANGGGTPGS
jgi:DNA-binding SARP family transcriptional activator/tetratricopeptide (TPR) repeat protein